MATPVLEVRPRADRLYELLPAYQRELDAEEGQPLRALLALITGEADAIGNDITKLFDDQFVETASRWALPYIGELVGNDLLHDLDLADAARTAESVFEDLAGPDLRPRAEIRLRADIARTIWYRRRKGTPAMLETLARDVTGWSAHVVEMFERLIWDQYLAHLRLASTGTVPLRTPAAVDLIGGPFDGASHTVDVRRIRQAEGWHGIRNVAVFLWRLRAYPITRSVPRPVAARAWRLTFSPLGNSAPLFAAARTQRDDQPLAGETNVTAPIRAAAFSADLAAAATTPTVYYGDSAVGAGSVVVFDAAGLPLPRSEIACVNLRTWPAAQPSGTTVGIDVVRGRMVVGDGRNPAKLRVTWHYGFSADLGGGPYERRKWLVPTAPPVRAIAVPGDYAALDLALDEWSLARSQDTVITITDDATHNLSRVIDLHPRARLAIQAADMCRPTVRPAGNVIQVAGNGPGSELTLGGLLVEGGIDVLQDIDGLRLLHTTLVPGRSIAEGQAAVTGPSLDVRGTRTGTDRINAGLRVALAFSITGPLRIPAHATSLTILDAVVDGRLTVGGPRDAAISDRAGGDGPASTIERSTILGTVRVRRLDMASESILADVVTVQRRQAGCVRFSYVAPGSATPRRYRCEPDLEIERRSEEIERAARTAGKSLPAGWRQTLVDAIVARLRPTFNALEYGQPAYAQLGLGSPVEIREGAEDGSEMGAFCHLKQPQREANLRLRFDEYLPLGLDAEPIYVT
jgi:hypothetical protein